MKCIFSNKEIESEEHIIPKWLQSKYDLYNQLLTIPNGSKVPYRKLKIPVCSEDNTLFGKVEKNISEGIYNTDEIYLWAFKIHIGLLMIDTTLKKDRKNRNSGNIFRLDDFSTQLELFQKLYCNWKNGNKTEPLSIGSVFILKSTLIKSQFDFVHCIVTNTIMLSFNNIFILVFLFDNNDAKDRKIELTWYDDFLHRENSIKEEKYIAQRVWACENAYHAYKRTRDIHLKEINGKLTLQRTKSVLKSNYSETEYSRICKMFGLILEEYNNFMENRYNIYVENKSRRTNE